MSDKRKYRITVSLQQTEFEVDAVDDCDAEGDHVEMKLQILEIYNEQINDLL